MTAVETTVPFKVGLKASLKNSSFKSGKEDLELTLEEVKHIITEMDLDLNEEEINLIFEKLDTKVKGKIKKNSLIDYFKGSNKKQSLKIAEFFLSNSENAINKLKRLQQKFEKIQDQEAIKDIDWIINVIVTNSWEYPDIDKQEEEGEGNEHDALKQYSHVQESMNKRNDITKITTSFRSNKNMSYNIGNKIKDNISEVSGSINTNTIPEEKSVFNRKNTQKQR
jgi:hypothetical protein